MKTSRIRRNKIGNDPLIQEIVENIENTGYQKILEGRLLVKRITARIHTKKLKRVSKHTIKEILNEDDWINIFKELEKKMGISQNELKEYFSTRFVDLVFHK